MKNKPSKILLLSIISTGFGLVALGVYTYWRIKQP